ncbi:MAG: M36 family metallopeptidase [Bacteroidetes bacterium]|nr:M36 family metallopeptidase [Bacteroidota bacterium]
MKFNFTPLRKSGTLLLVVFFVATAVKAQVNSQLLSRTGPDQTGDPHAEANRLLKKNLQPAGLSQIELNSYFVTDAYADKKTGLYMVYLQQGYAGIPVYRKIGVFVFRNDTLVSKTTNYIPIQARAAGLRTTPAVDGSRAIRAAAVHLALPSSGNLRLLKTEAPRQHFLYNGDGISKHDIPSDLVWLPVDSSNKVRLAWNMRIATPDGKSDWYIRVDAQSGEVIDKTSLIVSEKNPNDCEPTRGLKLNPPHAPAPLPGRPAPASVRPGGKSPGGQNGMIPGIVGEDYRGEVNGKEVAGTEVNGKVAPGTEVNGKVAPGIGAGTEVTAPFFFGTPAVTSDSYRVYPFPLESANYGDRVLDANPWSRAGAGNNATTLGWHYDNINNYNYTRGNNVWTLEDINGSYTLNGKADTSLTAIPSLTFDRAVDTSVDATTYSNLHGGMDNLFYWNNIMHDISYQYGFDEPAGNFQWDNQGRGGSASDMVIAFAQDGAGIDNSDFGTPPDGSLPVMRMFLWNFTSSSKLHISAPAGIAGDYNTTEGDFSYQNRLGDKGTVTGGIVYLTDASGTTHLACSAPGSSPSVSGKIAMIDRGTCNFTVKVKNAQNAGAIAVIIVQTSDPATAMSGNDSTITIPVVQISQTDGNTLKANLTGLTGSLVPGGAYRDGSLDNGIIAHEYTHGISNRLTGGPANTDCLSNAEQMGEGWSDYMALMVTTDWSTAAVTDGTKKRPLGTYVYGQSATGGGIRTYPYTTDISVNPWTYGMMKTNTGGEVHLIGEIWCATLWDMTWNIIQQEGIDGDLYHGTKGNNIALQLVMTGLKLQPCSPGFLDGRDAILKADSLLYDNRHKCAIWNAFARRGMGKSASQGSTDSYQDQTAATDLPSGVGLSTTASKTLLAQGDNVTYTIKASCDCQALTGISIVDTLSSNMSYVSSTGGSGGSYTSPAVHWDNNSFTAGETKTFTVTANVTGSYATPDTLINDTRDPANYTWTASAFGAYEFTDVTTKAHSGSHSWFATDQTSQDMRLTSGNLVPGTVSTLSFWHYYSTESTFDGGVVEISTDGGTTWTDLGPYMTQNGYNSSIDPGYFKSGWPSTASAIANRNAFSGSSGGQFIQTSVSLSSFAGQTVKIRYRFVTDGSTTSDGWYIDDILLTNESGTTSTSKTFNGTTLLSSSILSSRFAAAPLPVNFLSFDAKKLNGLSQLHWTVNDEIDAAKYIIERSTDGGTYTAIGEVPAANSGDYSFTDAQPVDGRDYYRIREQDHDGKPTISGIRLLQFNSKSFVVKLSPVPTYTHSVQLEIDADNNKAVTATLLSMTGQAVKVFVVRPGMNQLDLSDLSKGMYFLSVQPDTGEAQIRKLIIQ